MEGNKIFTTSLKKILQPVFVSKIFGSLESLLWTKYCIALVYMRQMACINWFHYREAWAVKKKWINVEKCRIYLPWNMKHESLHLKYSFDNVCCICCRCHWYCSEGIEGKHHTGFKKSIRLPCSDFV